MKYSAIANVISDKITGEWGTEPEHDPDAVKVIRTANFTNLGIIDYSNIVLRSISAKKVQQKRLVSGDVIIEKSGGSPVQPVGRVVYFEPPDGSPYLCNNFTTVLRPNRATIYPKYFFYVLYHNHRIKKTLRYQNKTTGIINLQLEKYLESQIPLPPLDDQIRIATVLTRAEQLIAKRKDSIKALDELLKSTFLEMFGDPVRNEKGWEESLLIDCCNDKHDIKCGPFGTQLSKSEYQTTGVPLWGIPQINSLFKINPVDFLTAEKAEQLSEYSIQENDIVMSRKGNVGKCALYPSHLPKGVLHSDVLRIRVSDRKANSVFICFQLRISKKVEKQIEGVSKGAIMAGINVGKLKSIYILVPPLPLQNQFAAIVEKVEALKAKYQQSLVELENLYGSLSQRAFKGELDLSGVRV